MARVIHALPGWLQPVLAFINTVDMETGVDEFAPGPTALAGWLAARELLAGPAAPAATRADLQLALDLRTGLRSLTLQNNGGPPDEPAMAVFSRALDRIPLVAEIGEPVLRPHRLSPVRAALGTIVAGYARAVGTGTWARIRQCPGEHCAWVFWDSSAKGSRRWCYMSICGNRAKARAFARRKARTRSDGA